MIKWQAKSSKIIIILFVTIVLMPLTGPAEAKAPISILARVDDTNPSGLSGINSSMNCDLDGDEIDDLAVGAYYDSGQTGKVSIYFGGDTLSSSPDLVINGETFNNRFGDGMSCGDFNGDGLGDLSVGAVRYNTYAGRNYVFYGRSRND